MAAFINRLSRTKNLPDWWSCQKKHARSNKNYLFQFCIGVFLKRGYVPESVENSSIEFLCWISAFLAFVFCLTRKQSLTSGWYFFCYFPTSQILLMMWRYFLLILESWCTAEARQWQSWVMHTLSLLWNQTKSVYFSLDQHTRTTYTHRQNTILHFLYPETGRRYLICWFSSSPAPNFKTCL